MGGRFYKLPLPPVKYLSTKTTDLDAVLYQTSVASFELRNTQRVVSCHCDISDLTRLCVLNR